MSLARSTVRPGGSRFLSTYVDYSDAFLPALFLTITVAVQTTNLDTSISHYRKHSEGAGEKHERRNSRRTACG